MKGIVIKYEKNNIDTDLIIPARYLVSSDPQYLAEHCMEDLDPNFNQKLKEHGYSILVAGSNFGSGSSREQAPLAIKSAGIQCVVAPSFARIFFRNSINIGLPIIEFKHIGELRTGHVLDIDLLEGTLENITTSNSFDIAKMPPFLQEIISSSGLLNFARKKIDGKN
ncbi:MAG: 3-isopropylmalate dehydratase small subunit [Candidatus Lokiarchaeota archaeon]|nr:3-isopropylmalate dehydratase small subunit [Candidatus Lokiarchaeota archaeon]MBD3338610.1 3-isopropylmalate dehydratase small subunit [Candidatus Lokiarchaeota archaeon]